VAESLTSALSTLRELLLDDTSLVRAVAAGRRRGNEPPWRRVEARYVDLKTGRHLQVTAYDHAQAHTRNHRVGTDAARAVDELLGWPFANWHVDAATASLQVRITKRGDALVHSRPSEGAPAVTRTHDRAKPRLVDTAEPWLNAIGIADHEGHIKPSRQAKFRQVEEFVRLLASAVDDALAAGRLPQPSPAEPLRVADLGCGNAYLTFAAFRHLTGRGLPVRLIGVDRNGRSRDRNTEIAEELGWDREMSFVAGSIAEAELDPPDIALALHACDTATDDALARAVRWQVPLVLAAPCCHRELQTQLHHTSAPSPYGLLTRHGIVREHFADVLTDALRAALMRMFGYRVQVVQFVGSEHTPRNTLIRAVRTGAEPTAELLDDYRGITEEWGVTPALARILAAETARVLE
jgi:SAM-dependent methyltransferase